MAGKSSKPRFYMNPLQQIEGASWIELSQGYYALLDDDLAKIVPKFCIQKLRKTMYGARYQRINKESPETYYLYLHRWVLERYGKEVPDQIDHINGNGLDNRLCNLRPATETQNKGNVGLNENNTTGYRGVHYDRYRLKWRASLTVKSKDGPGKSRFLGRFENVEDAARAYDRAAIEYFGIEFAYTNFPLTDYLTQEEIQDILNK